MVVNYNDIRLEKWVKETNLNVILTRFIDLLVKLEIIIFVTKVLWKNMNIISLSVFILFLSQISTKVFYFNLGKEQSKPSLHAQAARYNAHDEVYPD